MHGQAISLPCSLPARSQISEYVEGRKAIKFDYYRGCSMCDVQILACLVTHGCDEYGNALLCPLRTVSQAALVTRGDAALRVELGTALPALVDVLGDDSCLADILQFLRVPWSGASSGESVVLLDLVPCSCSVTSRRK
jgi:hypothetical protein